MRPTAVATSASEMPDMTAPAPPLWLCARSAKALMMPRTVPNRPMKGALLPSVPRTPRLRSRSRRNRDFALAMASDIASAPRSYCSSPAEAIFDSGARWPARARRAPAASPSLRNESSSLPSTSKSTRLAARKMPRSTMIVTDRSDRPMRSQRTHSEPSKVKPKIRSVRRMRSSTKMAEGDGKLARKLRHRDAPDQPSAATTTVA